MAKTTWNDLPMGECPHCGHEWQIDDYYDLDNGDTLECPKCEKEIHLDAKDTTVSFRFSTHADISNTELSGPQGPDQREVGREGA